MSDYGTTDAPRGSFEIGVEEMMQQEQRQSTLGIVMLAVIMTIAFAIGVAILDHFLFQ